MSKIQLTTAFALLGCMPILSSLEGAETGLYNQSAMVACENSWDITFNASYLYWAWQQPNTIVGTLATPTEPGAAGFLNGEDSKVRQNPGFASGFEVGLGVNFHGMDDWRLKADFTWYENTDQKRTLTSPGQYFAVSPTLIKTPFGLTAGVLLSDDLLSVAELDFSELDTTIQRIFYQSKSIVARFMMGLKALWIDESSSANGTDLSFIGEYVGFPVPLAGSFQTASLLQSWALGPVFGLESRWLLGYGLRVESMIKGSLVYSRYTNVSFSVMGQVSDAGSVDLTLSQSKDYNTVAPVVEASLGLGWGSYLCHRNLYLDLFVGYDFRVFWSRAILESIRIGHPSPGSLTLQGLNVRAGVDF